MFKAIFTRYLAAYCRASKATLDRINALPCPDAIRTDAVLRHLRRREGKLRRKLPRQARRSILPPNGRE